MRLAFDWLKPHPLWMADGSDYTQDFFFPQIVEYQTDDFMEAFLQNAAAVDPLAFRETQVVSSVANPVKLFQPTHGCFYLVCATLACRKPGFPDHTVSLAAGEKVYFVLRRFIDGFEYAWAISNDGKSHTWQTLNGIGREILPGEETLPLLPTTAFGDRKLWFGYLPLSGRETYAVSPKSFASNGDRLNIPLEEFKARFTTPLSKNLIADAQADDDANKNAPPRVVVLSIYMLLDLYEFFELYLKDFAMALLNPQSFSGVKAVELTQLMNLLKSISLSGTLNLADALTQVAKQRHSLNALGDADPLMANLGFSIDYSLAAIAAFTEVQFKQLTQAVTAALSDADNPDLQLPKFEVAKKAGDTTDAYYTVRCVYERPQCGLTPLTVSQPSQPFHVAAFFDGDAPSRPVRIPLPTDLSFSGMRKFNKNVTFMISDSLQRKIARLTGNEKSLLKDSPTLSGESDQIAWVCSFSIQIIFIVAFMLLLIFVIILNFVFWWLPFFRICLPLPKKWFAS